VHNPYIVGNYVVGPRHYGRHRVIDYLLNAGDDAIWVVGNRRMGKTSLLRQIELLTAATDNLYVPVFWDVQGCETAADLARELYYAFEDAEPRLSRLGVDLAAVEEADVRELLRVLRRAASAAGRKALLLIDESEAFIRVGRNDPAELQRLRKALQEGQGLRVIMTSTKALAEINDVGDDWETSPFLFGFALCNLWEMDWAAARDLIRQAQSAEPVQATDQVVETICDYTNRHPYLMQVLCQRLWEEGNRLREPTEADLAVDDMLAGFCHIDFRHLAPMERQIVLTVSQHGMLTGTELPATLGQSAEQVRPFVYSLLKLGYLRQVYGQLAIGNHFLATWLREHRDHLHNETPSVVTDRSTHALALRGQQQERAYLEEQLRVYRENLQELERQRAQFGLRVPLDLVNEINLTRREIEKAEQELQDLLDPHGAS
jgi:hypothetical protein